MPFDGPYDIKGFDYTLADCVVNSASRDRQEAKENLRRSTSGSIWHSAALGQAEFTTQSVGVNVNPTT